MEESHCGNCGATVEADAPFCAHCGHPLKPTDRVKCPFCTTVLDVSAHGPGAKITCGSCGKWIQVPGDPRLEQPLPEHLVGPAVELGKKLSDYLIISIVLTIFCCSPVGLVAIIFAAHGKTKLSKGFFQQALDAAEKSKIFCWVSFGLGLISTPLYILFTFGVNFLAAFAENM
jgi:Interferon-induced transmembrane protein/zinc-ribbon domain